MNRTKAELESDERALIGCALNDPKRAFKLLDVISPDQFVGERTRLAWGLILRGYLDPLAVGARMAEDSTGIGYSEAVAWLSEAMADTWGLAESAVGAARELVGESDIRKARKWAEDIIARSKERGVTAEDMAAAVADFQARSARPEGAWRMFREVFESAIERNNEPTQYPIGIPEIDELRDYSEPGTLLAIGAEPGMGKSSLMRQMAVAYVRYGITVAFWSLEDPCEAVGLACACMAAGVDYSRFVRGYADSAAREKILAASANIERARGRLMFSRRYSASASEISVHVRHLPRPLVVMVDHVGLLNHPDGRTMTDRVTQTSRDLRMLALEEQCSVIEAVQLTKAPASRQDGEPILADLRDSGMIGADASDVLMLWSVGHDRARDDRMMKIEKNRHGPVRRFAVGFQRHGGGRFVGMEQAAQQEMMR